MEGETGVFHGAPPAFRIFLETQDGAAVVHMGIEWWLYASAEIPLIYGDYRFAQYLPGALPISTVCAGALFALDLRESGTALVVRVSVGDLSWDTDCTFV